MQQIEPFYNCNFCNNKYKTISSLNYHQKTAKFCIQLQNRELKTEEKFICNFCNKDFILKHAYTGHILICKEKKTKEENDNQKSLEELKEEIKKVREENEKLKHEKQIEFQQLKEEVSNLKLTIQFKDEQIKNKDEQISKLEKTTTTLINKPTSIINNDNRKTQYNIQFNQLFEKLEVLNENNVNKRINTMSTEEQIREYNVENFTTEFTEKLIYALKDLAFCTDQSRKTVVFKDENFNSIKISAEEMLSKCLQLGTTGIRSHFTLTEQIVDDRINNDDQTLTSKMLDKFEEQIKELKQFILDNGGTINLKDPNNPLKKFTIPFIKTIEQHYKGR
jgi:hypothetical protein